MGKVFRASTVILSLLVLSLTYAKRIPATFIEAIPEITKEAFWWYTASQHFHGTDVIIQFENDNQIGAAWLSGYGDTLTYESYWVYNYVRFDTTGKIVTDCRDFVRKKDYSDRFGVDREMGTPAIDFAYDNHGNSWIVYSYLRENRKNGWHISWARVDQDGRLVYNDTLGLRVTNRWFITCASDEFGFHLFGANYHTYLNPHCTKEVSLYDQYEKPYPMLPSACIEIDNSRVLAVGINPYSRYIHCQRISATGKLVSLDTLNLDAVATTYWTQTDLPGFQTMYRHDDLIYYIYCTGKEMSAVVFNGEGEVIPPKHSEKGQIFSVDLIPENAQRFMKIETHKSITYYFAVNENNHLYCWNSRLGYRSTLFPPFYAVHYDHVKDKIDNPITDNGFFPDSIGFPKRWAEGWGVPRVENLWSKGGPLKHGLKLVIGCNNPKKSYKAGELVGLRCAIGHARFGTDTYLAKAYYSPNKHGWPPGMTFYIDAPEDAAKEKLHIMYLGDDAIWIDRPAYDLIKIPPGKAFNPSPDQHYYNKWAGIYEFRTPGVYRICCSYTFDSLSSNIKVGGVDTLFSDTLEIIIE